MFRFVITYSCKNKDNVRRSVYGFQTIGAVIECHVILFECPNPGCLSEASSGIQRRKELLTDAGDRA